ERAGRRRGWTPTASRAAGPPRPVVLISLLVKALCSIQGLVVASSRGSAVLANGQESDGYRGLPIVNTDSKPLPPLPWRVKMLKTTSRVVASDKTGRCPVAPSSFAHAAHRSDRRR